jgi:N-methylhydantoinase A
MEALNAVASYRLGVDIGGTFTDILLLAPDGSLSARKVPSTPDDYSRGILDGLSHILAELHIDGASVAAHSGIVRDALDYWTPCAIATAG